MALAARFSGAKASASSRGLRSGSTRLRTRAAKICLAVAITWGSGLPFAGSAGRCQPRANRSGAGRAAEDTMGELFTKYYRLQEVNRNLEAETKVAVVSELLEASESDRMFRAQGLRHDAAAREAYRPLLPNNSSRHSHVSPSMYVCMYACIHPSIYLSISFSPSLHLSIHPSIHLSSVSTYVQSHTQNLSA
ncbi:grpE [Symbiodinium sp. CCMP2592]|nr:grpE [Symbiodinium sp. CCMP2592]